MADEIDVLQDVLVLSVVVDGTSVVVDVYGSPANVCGTVRIELPDAGRRWAAVSQLTRWRRRDTPLTLIVRDSAIVLQDDRAAFGPQLAPSLP
ncbi:MAG TPA: hypothetical protein VGO60_15010 [Iamia sp.]|jgi:hypothetical protein|nr:hypothetical protein [Iamia sp.]